MDELIYCTRKSIWDSIDWENRESRAGVVGEWDKDGMNENYEYMVSIYMCRNGAVLS